MRVRDIDYKIARSLTPVQRAILSTIGISDATLDAGICRSLADSQIQIHKQQELISTQNEQLQEKEKENLELRQRLAKLEKPIANSNNSSVPPSRNPIGIKHTNSLRQPSGKKSGGQKGHEGKTKYRSLHPDQFVDCLPTCPCCGEPLSKEDCVCCEKRQVIDIPTPIIPITTEYIAYKGVCSKCNKEVKGSFPAEAAAPVSYGPNTHALVAYLSTIQAIPFKRLTDVLENCFGLSLSQGTIANILNSMRKKAKLPFEYCHKLLELSEVIGGDETGGRVNGKNVWFWVFQTELLTYIFLADGRGREEILTRFQNGFPKSDLVTDRLAAYFHEDVHVKGHQLCLAHLLRNLTYLSLLLPEEKWVTEFMDLLRTSIHRRKEEGASEKLYQELQHNLEELLQRPTPCDKPENEERYKKLDTFKNQMIKHQEHIFPFLKNNKIPADNNGSERTFRNVKTKMKVSGQFKSKEGAENYATLQSIVQTAQKNGQDPFLALVELAMYHPT